MIKFYQVEEVIRKVLEIEEILKKNDNSETSTEWIELVQIKRQILQILNLQVHAFIKLTCFFGKSEQTAKDEESEEEISGETIVKDRQNQNEININDIAKTEQSEADDEDEIYELSQVFACYLRCYKLIGKQ